jgi:hypothetical protein
MSELLIPAISAVRVAARHDFSTQLIGPATLQSMAQQCGSHFEGHAEILQPGGERVAEIVEVEIGHPGLAAQSSPERAKRGGVPSPEDSPVHMHEVTA